MGAVDAGLLRPGPHFRADVPLPSWGCRQLIMHSCVSLQSLPRGTGNHLTQGYTYFQKEAVFIGNRHKKTCPSCLNLRQLRKVIPAPEVPV